jgi:hypothetical protein
MLSVLRLYIIDNGMINEHGVVVETTIGRERDVLGEHMPQCHFAGHKSHMT